MADNNDNDDFDKVDDDFASEFELDDEPKNMAPPPEQPPSAPNFNAILKPIIVLTVIVAGGYYGMQYFNKNKSTDTATVAADNTTISETVSATEETVNAEVPSMEALAESESNPADSVDNLKPKPETLDSALSQNKTFEQVQKELKVQHTEPKVKQIPEEVNIMLDSLSEEMTLNANQIKNLETSINSLAQAIEQLNLSINAMDNRVLSLNETVDNMMLDLNHVKKIIVDEDLDLTQIGSTAPTSKKQLAAANNIGPSYTVHAIIPGRAWLRSDSGQIITVTEGDKVGDYGSVAVIDANNGLVRTSSGITFR